MREPLRTKRDLAKALSICCRSVDNLLRRKMIPVIRISPRCLRFDLDAVRAALARFEVEERGRKQTRS